MDRVESVVAEELLDGMIAGIAGPAEDLNRVVIGFQAPYARPGLHNRSEHVEEECCTGTLGLGVGGF